MTANVILFDLIMVRFGSLSACVRVDHQVLDTFCLQEAESSMTGPNIVYQAHRSWKWWDFKFGTGQIIKLSPCATNLL